MSGCSDRGDDAARSRDEPPPPPPVPITATHLQERTTLLVAKAAPGETLFEIIDPEASGVTSANVPVAGHPMAALYATAAATGGLALGDIDGDGLPDLVCAGGGAGGVRLYRMADAEALRFEDITVAAGLGTASAGAWSLGVAIEDFDNDGDRDLFVCNHGAPNQLFLNGGGSPPRFEEAAEAAGLATVTASHTAAFADYDLDGDLDIYLLTNPGEGADGTADLLFRNGLRPGGALRFTDVTVAAGVAGLGHGVAAVWWDFNNDRWPDLYVANDGAENDRLFMNNGDGSFIDLSPSALPSTPHPVRGADVADVDGDGRLDLFVAGTSGTTHYRRQAASPPEGTAPNALYLNTGTLRFVEAAHLAGIAHSDLTWGVKLDDFDNDGRPDLFCATGAARDFAHRDLVAALGNPGGDTPLWTRHLAGQTDPHPQQNLAFRNLGGLRFENATTAWLPAAETIAMAATSGDLDRDGDLDLVVTNMGEPVSILRNTSTDGESILVRLRGTLGHPSGLGARVTLTAGGSTQTHEIGLGRGFLASGEPVAHFGVGDASTVGRLNVLWPSGHVQEFEDLPVNYLYEVREPDAPVPPVPEDAPPPPARWFAEPGAIAADGEIRHTETPSDEFENQPLLPRKLSQLGPGLAVADVDADGDDDFFLGGAAGTPGRVMINDGNGMFRAAPDDAFRAAAASEDLGALFFEADGDADPDLYVVSGGVEVNHGSIALLDRLYLNDGAGGFSPAPDEALPKFPESGSCVAAADFDRDGDLDLFVGGRVTPNRYPFGPSNRLLVNKGDGTFADGTDAQGDGFAFTGMTTAALWSDVDRDGWADLLIAHEWGPVLLIKNDEGSLAGEPVAVSEPGWWHSLAARDLDGDGDIDYVAGNHGLNSHYRASTDEPAILYAGAFDESGDLRLVEARTEAGRPYPVRGRDAAAKAIPSLAIRFPTFHDYAAAPLDKIYLPERLAAAYRLDATELASGVLLNDGSGGLTFHALPHAAQLAPVHGIALTEIDGDGHPDLVGVQNLWALPPGTGRWNAGAGFVMRGTGGGGFAPVPADVSGFVAPFDARALALLDSDTDGREDVLVANNDHVIQLFRSTGSAHPPEHTLRVRLVGGPMNPNAIGARVSVLLSDGTRQIAEIAAGSGYLSQSGPLLVFGLPQSANASAKVEVRWADGSESTHDATGKGGSQLTLIHEPAE